MKQRLSSHGASHLHGTEQTRGGTVAGTHSSSRVLSLVLGVSRTESGEWPPAEPSRSVLEIITSVCMPECVPGLCVHMYVCCPYVGMSACMRTCVPV